MKIKSLKQALSIEVIERLYLEYFNNGYCLHTFCDNYSDVFDYDALYDLMKEQIKKHR